MKQWYAVYTHARAEHTAKRHLERQGFFAYLPQYLKRRRHARRIERVPTPLFPRYVLVQIDLESSRWRAVRSTIGVSALVCQGDRPASLPAAVVAEIRAREDESGMVAMDAAAGLAKGTPVRIDAGPLCDQVGLFAGLTDKERVVVLLNLLGRQVRATVPLGAVSACA